MLLQIKMENITKVEIRYFANKLDLTNFLYCCVHFAEISHAYVETMYTYGTQILWTMPNEQLP